MDKGVYPIFIYPQYFTIWICAEKKGGRKRKKGKGKGKGNGNGKGNWKRKGKGKGNGKGNGKGKGKGSKSGSYSLCHEPVSIFAAHLLPGW